jgi:2-polyprenyl-3-methyl-5-hydroxy-6-metoxy-1,4-benzoquinol methylase
MTATCRICSASIDKPDYKAAPPSITSTGNTVPCGLEVFVCRTCAHAQSSELRNLEKYYDTDYKISLSSNDHDQLYEIVDGRNVFRTDKQCDLVRALVELAPGMMILDYGAAKAATLRKICNAQPGLRPHVFDVSNAYAAHWKGWLEPGDCATYELPSEWSKRFDVVTAHFVLEHVTEPLTILRKLKGVLKRGGRLFMSVPNVLANTGDLLVADHINHFTPNSLRVVLAKTGFEIEVFEDDAFRGAFVVVARAGETRSIECDGGVAATPEEIRSLLAIADLWTEASSRIVHSARTHTGKRCAIYGAGFYGSFIATRLAAGAEIVCFVDRNPHVRCRPHFGLPVVAPEDLPPDVSVVYAGLNPAQARSILSHVKEWRERKLETVFLGDS